MRAHSSSRCGSSAGYDVRLVENITDINDKIYAAAPGASADLAERASRWYIDDTDELGLGRPDAEPKASETVPQIVRFIEELIEGGSAYQADGDVYFRVATFDDYGRLSGRVENEGDVFGNPSEEQEASTLKEDPRDFALWKANKPGEDTWWDAPWGRGRPGWHIECSVMAEEELGPSFEIHGGGLDLVFPHHENEIAQSRSAGREFARIWMHNGMLRLAGEKMSKSLGNDVSLRSVLYRWGPETLLVFYLRAHWRKPIDYSEELMEQAQAEVETLRNAFRTPARDGEGSDADWARFAAALDDDFDTPAALAVMHDWRRRGQLALLRRGLAVFGLGSLAESAEAPPEIQELARRRHEARAGRDFEAADRLRGEIEQAGWEIRDVSEAPGFQLVPRP
jgi:cysteinyl-tRNA synthetase